MTLSASPLTSRSLAPSPTITTTWALKSARRRRAIIFLPLERAVGQFSSKPAYEPSSLNLSTTASTRAMPRNWASGLMAWVNPPLTMAMCQPAARSWAMASTAVGSTVAMYLAPIASSSARVGLIISRRLAKISSMGVPPFIAALVISSTALKTFGPRRRPNSSIPSMDESVESQSKSRSLLSTWD